jgi:hypothetical protein
MTEPGLGDDTMARIVAVLDRLNPEERAQVEQRLRRVITHRKAIARFPTPGHLGQFIQPDFKQTPMLDAIDAALVRAEAGVAPRVIINCPPQEGKSTRLQAGALWMLLRRPTRRIAFASYEQGIAAQSGVAIRQMIESHGSGVRGWNTGRDVDRVDSLGLMLDSDRMLQTNWSLADVPGAKTKRPGGVLSVGIGSSFTGRPADVIIIDDPLKDAKQADSPVYRQAVKDWYQSVATARLSSGAIVIVVQTRWHEDDLTGWLLSEDAMLPNPQWTHLNIPAQAGHDDPLGRKPGEFLASARGRTKEEWEEKKRTLQAGRWWNALYQGDPRPPEGGVFQREWFDKYRVAAAPELSMAMVVIDPADNDGTGDEAGVVTLGIGAADRELYVLDDSSGHYTVAKWVRVALFALLRNKASRLVYERSLSNLQRSIREQWKVIRKQARLLVDVQAQWTKFGEDDWTIEPNAAAIDDVLRQLIEEEDSAEEIVELKRQLVELWPYAPRVLRLPPTGPPVKAITAVGSKALRAELVSPLVEQGLVHHVGRFPKLEHQACTWLPTQDSPDRMDAWVHALDQGSQMAGKATVSGAKGNMPRRQRPVRAQILPQVRY